MEDNTRPLRSALEFLKSKEGQMKMDEFIAQETIRKKRYAYWKTMIANHICNIKDKEFESFMIKVISREKRYGDFGYNKGIIRASNVFGILYNLWEEYGNDVTTNEIFLSGAYNWRGYTFELYCGQGCYTKVLKNNKLIFTTL